MNVAIVIAGGTGKRMGQDIPKQFISVYDKPILIYTLEGFQSRGGSGTSVPRAYLILRASAILTILLLFMMVFAQ